MGNCNTRKFPEDGSSKSWRQCGAYNDWTTDENFCTPVTNNNSNDAKFCNGIGGESEWKLRKPAHQQSENEFIQGGDNSATALQAVISKSGQAFDDLKNSSQSKYNSTVKDMRSKLKHEKNHSVNPKDDIGMGPLYGQALVGDQPVPLWENWLSTYSDNEFPHCKYNDWRKNGVQGSGCCSKHYTSCGIIGGMKVSCLRDSFAANKDEYGSISCCFNDLVCEPGAEKASQIFSEVGSDGTKTPWASNSKCFRSGSDTDMRTCKPESRDLGSNFCRDTISPYCTGDKLFPGQTHWTQSWDITNEVNVNETDFYQGKQQPVMVKGPCAQLLMRQINGIGACGQTFDQFQINVGSASLEGLLWSKTLLQNVFTNYIEEYGSPILGVNQDGIEAAVGVNNFLYNICQKFPALCTDALYDMCQTVTEERISQNPTANKWCGCYMPEAQYQKYNDGSFLITKQCTPFCSRDTSIPIVDDDYQPLVCQQNICLMNNIFLDFVKSEGAVNFNQVCNNCGKNSTVESSNGSTSVSTSTTDGTTGNTNVYNSSTVSNAYSNTSNSQIANSCQCKLDGVNLEAVSSKFSNINFANECGGTQCTDSSGNSIPCSGSGSVDTNPNLPPINTNISNLKNLKTLTKFKKIFLIGLIVFLLISLYYLFFGSKKRVFEDANGKIFSLKKNQTFTIDNGIINIK